MNTPLGHEVIGSGQHTVVFLHGFTQTRVSWRPIASRLVTNVPNLRALLIDLPGHGDSSRVSADIDTTAALINECAGNATYVGYSLGARITLSALATFPTSVQQAIVISGTGGIDNEVDRAVRRAADATLAERIHTIGIAAFIDEWLAQPMFRELSSDVNLHAERLSNTAAGLADSLLRCGQGSQAPLWQQLRSCPNPVLTIAGARDEKYVVLARRLASTLPNARLHIVPNAGHSVHLEKPSEVGFEIEQWCANWLQS
jgi:2-succinyl-6-hydroxy-2,4-cyclohexadiene-1-carboxylate synthase